MTLVTSDGELIQRAATGDRSAFEDLYRRYARPVFGLALRRLGDRGRAEDALQETFVSIWRSAATYKPERGPGAPWLYGVARKVLANQRRAARRRAGELSLPVEDVAVVASDGRLRDALAQLGPRDREVLALVAWEGLALREAAVVLGCSPVACRVRFHRAKRRLARLLEDDAGTLPHPRIEGANR